ncbi:hypothetical protein FB451DRAFT_1014346, partial [Mycena latifolia]
MLGDVQQPNVPDNPPQNAGQDPDHPMPPPNPLSEKAISDQDQVLMDGVRKKIMDIRLESCGACHEHWFDLQVVNDKCQKCRKRTHPEKFQTSNMMNPGIVPGPDVLPPLTQIEEMIISPVHALVSLYQIRG